MSNVDMVRDFLRGQNLEQIGRRDEAIDVYESVVERGFDAAGPYDRLIALYGHRASHSDVVRVADAALDNVHTYEDKRSWYRRMRADALAAQGDVPRPAPRGTE